MYISFNFFQLLILAGAVNGLIWSALIFVKKKGTRGNVFLGLLLLVFALGSIKIVLQEKIPYFNHYLPVPLLYQFTFGPLLYFYLKTAVTDGYRFSANRLWHFVPSLLFDLLPALILFNLTLSQYTTLVQKPGFLMDILAFVLFTVYGCLSFSLIRQYKNSINGAGNKAMIKWTDQVMGASFLITVSWFMYILWVIFLKGRSLSGMMPYYPIYLVLCCCIYALGIAGYYRPEIGLLYLPVKGKRELIPPAELTDKKAALLQKMKEQDWYREEDINLQILAKYLGIPVNELSYIINTGFSMNFNDFINGLRVEDFKQRLANPTNNKFSLMGLAYDSGFNSKASFYRAFKKATGQTPSQFYKAGEKSA
ncbi:helix-turn-helix domain-containing protein [Chitinophaga oryziterrae]|uniref:Helix-turn-helix domain-containing protein n=1 Tax=Chitinophaga oryziterrae TaxID=1031224 RepID=A0A6N8JBW3_9BACT|nr:helix-turn-helix domain-containing protein [Chitinophaga oryziterrae]